MEWFERLLYKLLTSIQAIQTKTKAVSDFWRYQMINRSNYELKNLSLTGSLKSWLGIYKTKIPQKSQQKNLAHVSTNSLLSWNTLR